MAEPSTDQPQTTSVEPTESRHGGVGLWLLWLPVVLVIYVLSVGPAAKYVDFLYGPPTPPRKALRAIYSPLAFLCQEIPTVSWYINWYISLWKPIPTPTSPAPSPPPTTSGTSTN
jgi:hypothetical protein